MATTTPSPDGSQFHDNDEETFSFLVELQKDVKPRLDPLFQRIRQDPIDTTPWTRWTQQCQQRGIAVPSFSPYQPETPTSTPKIPGSFDTPAGKAHLKSIQAILQIDNEFTAAQITLSCMRDVSEASEPGQNVYGSHALVEKVLDYAYRQRIVRLRVIAEALRAERDMNHGYREPLTKLLDGLDQKSVCSTNNHSKRGIFMFLLLTACIKETELTREQLLPAKELWVRSAEEKRDQINKDREWKALGHRIMGRHKTYIVNARKEALEALTVLLYGRLEVTRSDYALLLTAFDEQGFFADFAPRMGYLAGLICMEACALNATTKGGDWTDHHLLVQGTDALSVNERRVLVHMLDGMMRQRDADKNKSQGLAALSLGCLFHLAGLQEGYDLAMSAIDNCQSDVFLEETMTQLVEPPNTEPEVVDLEWFQATDERFDSSQDSNGTQEDVPSELSAPCKLYASVGREVVVALLSTFGNLLFNVGRNSFVENINVVARLVQVVHSNSTDLCSETWGEWIELKTRERRIAESPLCHAIYLAKDLAAQCSSAGERMGPLAKLEAAAPLLKLVSSLVFDSASLCEVMDEMLPPSVLYTVLFACQSSSIDHEKMQRMREEIFRSVAILVGVAQTDRSRAIIRDGMTSGSLHGRNIGPLDLFKIAIASRSSETLRLVTTIVAGLLPGARQEWFSQASFGLDGIQEKIPSGTFGQDNKGPTEALVHLTHTLVLQVNAVFFAKDFKDSAVLAGLKALARAVTAVSSVLKLSTSALSGNMFGGKSLPHNISSKILMTLGNALVILRPLYYTRPNREIHDSISGIVNAVITDVSLKTGLGDSVLFFATLPAALGLAFAMRETAKDIELSAVGTLNTANLEAMLSSCVFQLDKISIDLNALETRGWLEDESANGVRQVSMAAMRLLLLVFEYMNPEDQDTAIPSNANPCEIIMSEALPSLAVRRSSEISSAWSSSRIRYLQLLLRQLGLEGEDRCIGVVGFSLFDCYIGASFQDFAWALSSLPLLRNVIDSTFKQLKAHVEAGSSLPTADARAAASCLATLQRCIEFNISVVNPKEGSEKWKVLVDTVLAFGKKSPGVGNEDIVLCDACLQVLLSLRKKQVALNEKEYFEASNTFLSEIASLALKDFHKTAMFREWSSTLTLQKSKAVLLVSTALQFLTLEIQRAAGSSGVSDSPVFSSLIGVLENVQGLSIWVQEALSVEATASFMKGLLSFRDSIERDFGLHREVLCDLVRLYGNDSASKALSFWLISFRGSERFWPSFPKKLYHLRAIYVYLRNETNRAATAGRLLSLLSRDRQHLKSLANGFTSATCLLVARYGVDSNMKNIEDAATSMSVYGLVDEVSDIVERFSSLLVEVTKNSGSSWGREEVLELQKILGGNASRALMQLGGERKHAMVVEKLLLVATSLASTTNTPQDARSAGYEDSVRVQTDLARIACQTLRRFDRVDSSVWNGRTKDIKEASMCFRACVGFLRHVCKCAKSSGEAKHFSYVLSKVLIESNASSSLVRCVSDPMIREQVGPEGVLSVFHLFQSMSSLDNKQLLSSVLTSAIRPALAANFKSVRSDSIVIAQVKIRGYISLRSNPLRWSPYHMDRPANNHVSLQIGRDDLQHEIQIAGTSFVANALRSIASSGIFADQSSKAICSIALDYLGNFADHFLECLGQVSSISFHSDVKSLTIRSVREATAIVSLVAGLCRHQDEFKQRFPKLFGAFLDASVAVARSMCSFLGASGASRELFSLQDNNGTGLSPLSSVISLSLSNPRHEAIRYSHFVSSWCAAVTEAETEQKAVFPGNWKPPNGQVSEDSPQSESALGEKSKRDVSSEFAFTLEAHAGKCLFHAIDVILKTHPITSSFVVFSETELQRLDPGALVKVGTVICFHDNEGRDGLCYGKVWGTDLARRTWILGLITGGGDVGPVTIHFEQLVGIEDSSMRKTALKYAPAAESSAESEKQGSSLSTGHLISALRWCHEYTLQLGRSSSVAHLAEILSVLLGMEVAIAREEPQKVGEVSRVAGGTLSIQLLDLFGGDGELCADSDTDTPYGFRRDGRLNLLMSTEAWDAVRAQLRPELDLAINDLKERREKKRGRSSDGDGWLAIRRSSPSTRSPFRQLSV